MIVDVRAVSGSRVTVASWKTVLLTPQSVGGSIDFEIWARISGTNSSIADEGLHNIGGGVLTTQFGRGGVAGNLNNLGDVRPGVPRGNVAPFNWAGSQRGAIQNLDSDRDLEIGGTGGALLAGRTHHLRPGRDTNGGWIAELLFYRFSLPISGVLATVGSDATYVNFSPAPSPTSFLWLENDQPRNRSNGSFALGAPVRIGLGTSGGAKGKFSAASAESIPEPKGAVLGLVALIPVAWRRSRRQRKKRDDDHAKSASTGFPFPSSVT
jgi:hypothetical protein